MNHMINYYETLVARTKELKEKVLAGIYVNLMTRSAANNSAIYQTDSLQQMIGRINRNDLADDDVEIYITRNTYGYSIGIKKVDKSQKINWKKDGF